MWASDEVILPVEEKKLLVSESGTGSLIKEYTYLAIDQDYLEENMNDFFFAEQYSI